MKLALASLLVLSTCSAPVMAHDYKCFPLSDGLAFIEDNHLELRFTGGKTGESTKIYIFSQENNWLTVAIDDVAQIMCLLQSGDIFTLIPEGELM